MPFLGKTPSQIVDPEVDIDGGTIDGVSIGSVTANAGAFTNLTATGTITFPDDGISGDDINGGTISNVAISGTTASFSGDLTVDTNTLHVDSTNNLVGIGTDNPSSSLTVDSSGPSPIALTRNDGAGGNCSIAYLNDTYNWYAGVASDTSYFGISRNADIRQAALTVAADGNVSIGNDSPASLVTGGSSPVLSIGGTDGGLTTGEKAGALSFITSDGSYTGTYSDGITGEIVSVAESTTGAAYGLAFYTGTTTSSNRGERLRIDKIGNVGIGTNSPESLLSVGVGTATTGTFIKTSLALRPGWSATAGTMCNTMMWQGTDVTEQNPFGSANTTSEGVKNFYAGLVSTNAYFNSPRWSLIQGGLERLSVDTSGNLLVGTTVLTDVSSSGTGNEGAYIRPDGQVGLATSNDSSLILNRKTSDGAIAKFRKNGTLVGTIGVINSDNLFISGTVASHAGIQFGTNTVAPMVAGAGVDNVVDLGSTSDRFDDVYATNGTINTSDANEKQDIEALSEAEQRVAVAAKALLRKFRWKSAVEEKGDDARVHFGIIAQDLQAAFEAEGLDAGRYGMFIHSTWWEHEVEVPAVVAQDAVYETQTDEEGNEIQVLVSEAVEGAEAYTQTNTYNTAEEAPEGAVERSRMGVRYSELLAFIVAAI